MSRPGSGDVCAHESFHESVTDTEYDDDNRRRIYVGHISGEPYGLVSCELWNLHYLIMWLFISWAPISTRCSPAAARPASVLAVYADASGRGQMAFDVVTYDPVEREEATIAISACK